MEKMHHCALNFLVKTGNKRNRSSSSNVIVGSDAMQKTTKK